MINSFLTLFLMIKIIDRGLFGPSDWRNPRSALPLTGASSYRNVVGLCCTGNMLQLFAAKGLKLNAEITLEPTFTHGLEENYP